MGIRAVCYPVHRFEWAALEYTLSNHPPPRPSYPPLVATQMKLRPRSSISRCAYLRVKRRFSPIHPFIHPFLSDYRYDVANVSLSLSLSLRFLLTPRWLWFFCNCLIVTSVRMTARVDRDIIELRTPFQWFNPFGVGMRWRFGIWCMVCRLEWGVVTLCRIEVEYLDVMIFNPLGIAELSNWRYNRG